MIIYGPGYMGFGGVLIYGYGYMGVGGVIIYGPGYMGVTASVMVMTVRIARVRVVMVVFIVH